MINAERRIVRINGRRYLGCFDEETARTLASLYHGSIEQPGYFITKVNENGEAVEGFPIEGFGVFLDGRTFGKSESPDENSGITRYQSPCLA